MTEKRYEQRKKTLDEGIAMADGFLFCVGLILGFFLGIGVFAIISTQ